MFQGVFRRAASSWTAVAASGAAAATQRSDSGVRPNQRSIAGAEGGPRTIGGGVIKGMSARTRPASKKLPKKCASRMFASQTSPGIWNTSDENCRLVLEHTRRVVDAARRRRAPDKTSQR